MMKLPTSVLGLTLVVFATAVAAEPVPLEIVDKHVEKQFWEWDEYRITDLNGEVRTLTRDEVPPKIVQHFTFRNTSDKVIDAWSFSCLQANSAGLYAFGGGSSDGYLTPERGRGPGGIREGLTYPGDTLEITRKRRPDAGKYYAEQCRIDAVVFTDGTWAGEETVARDFFEKRLRHAVDARNALAWAEDLLHASGTSKTALASSAEALRERLEEQQNIYAFPVRRDLEWRRSSMEPGDEDLLPFFTGQMKAMQADLEQILSRLPEEWQAAFHDAPEASK